MIRDYFNQTATWYKAGVPDMYGAPSFTEQAIKVRWEFKRRLVRNKEGVEVVSECRVFCQEPVQSGDALAYEGVNYPVINHAILPGLDGIELYREVSA
jgi:hypothetical protein